MRVRVRVRVCVCACACACACACDIGEIFDIEASRFFQEMSQHARTWNRVDNIVLERKKKACMLGSLRVENSKLNAKEFAICEEEFDIELIVFFKR